MPSSGQDISLLWGLSPRTDLMRTTFDPLPFDHAAHTLKSLLREGLHEKPKIEDVRFLSSATCLVPSLLHSHCALRHQDDLPRKGLSPGVLREGIAYGR